MTRRLLQCELYTSAHVSAMAFWLRQTLKASFSFGFHFSNSCHSHSLSLANGSVLIEFGNVCSFLRLHRKKKSLVFQATSQGSNLWHCLQHCSRVCKATDLPNVSSAPRRLQLWVHVTGEKKVSVTCNQSLLQRTMNWTLDCFVRFPRILFRPKGGMGCRGRGGRE